MSVTDLHYAKEKIKFLEGTIKQMKIDRANESLAYFLFCIENRVFFLEDFPKGTIERLNSIFNPPTI